MQNCRLKRSVGARAEGEGRITRQNMEDLQGCETTFYYTIMVNKHQYAAAAAAKSFQSCPTLCDPIDGSPQTEAHQATLSRDSPGKNTGVGCHFLLQCMKVKSESEVAKSCPTLSDPMDCSPPGSSIHGIFQARVLEWGAIVFSVISVVSNSVRPYGL